MKTMNGVRIIGIDHGYGNMKTANVCFPTGVMASDTEPTFKANLLVWNGRYYNIGVGHKEFAGEKDGDEDFYILTLAAIAEELPWPVSGKPPSTWRWGCPSPGWAGRRPPSGTTC